MLTHVKRSLAAAALLVATGFAQSGDAKLVADLEKNFADLDAAVRSADVSGLEPFGVIETVGRDADELAAWVKRTTHLLPYRGVLRGPSGTLIEGGGNSLDRALLLAQLLTDAGHEVRLANVTLSAGVARDLAAAITAPAEATVADAAARDRVARQHRTLLAALDQAGVKGTPQDVAAALADHWWVQRKTGETWVDHELTGLPKQTAVRIAPFAMKEGRLALDAALFHEVELAVVIEVFAGGKLTTTPVLRKTYRPYETLGQSITLAHTAGRMVSDDDLAGGDMPGKLRAATLKQTVFMPVLRTGTRSEGSASFTVTGQVIENATFDGAGRLADRGKNFDEGFDVMSGQAATKPAAAGVLTAQFVDYTLRVPVQPARTIRRTVFDAVGPAARAAGVTAPPQLTEAQKIDRALALLGQTQITLQTGRLPADFTVYRVAREQLREKDLWLGIARGEYVTPDRRGEALDRIGLLDVTTPGVASLRDLLAAGDTFVDEPNVITHTSRLAIKDDGTIVARRVLDLAHTSTAARAGGFAGRVKQGVADTLA